MGNSVFNSAPTVGGAYSIDRTSVNFPTSAGVQTGGIVQSIQSAFTRPVQRMFDLSGQRKVYYVMGNAEGRLTIGRMAAPAVVTSDFLNTFSDLCNIGAQNNISIETTPGTLCTQSPKSTLMFKFCILSAIQHSIAVGNVALTENIAMEFAELTIN